MKVNSEQNFKIKVQFLSTGRRTCCHIPIVDVVRWKCCFVRVRNFGRYSSYNISVFQFMEEGVRMHWLKNVNEIKMRIKCFDDL